MSIKRHVRYCGLLKLVSIWHGGHSDPFYTVHVFDQSGSKPRRVITLRKLRLAPFKRQRVQPDAETTHTMVASEAMQFLSAIEATSDTAHGLGHFEYGDTEDVPVIRHLAVVRNPSRGCHV